MIFADKLIQLRKKAGWSQEELAEQMNVTRQSVSKWEGAQSVPDLEKMIRLSELFGVSTDYLLKDEIETMERTDPSDKASLLRRVSMEEANDYLSVRAGVSRWKAFATFMFMLSPITLFILGAFSTAPAYRLPVNAAGGIGMIAFLIFNAIAISAFALAKSRLAPFAYLEEAFETEYGVGGMVKERQKQFQRIYTGIRITAICLCVSSLIPLYAGVIINEQNVRLLAGMLACTFLLLGMGFALFVYSSAMRSGYEKLLQAGRFSIEEKKKAFGVSLIAKVYWIVTAAIYFGYSFSTNHWNRSWMIWILAGVLFAAVIRIVRR